MRQGTVVKVLRGHTSSVYALKVYDKGSDQKLLRSVDSNFLTVTPFSSEADATIRVWRATPPFNCLVLLECPDGGDVLSLAYVEAGLFAGFQVKHVSQVAADHMRRTRASDV